VDEYRLENMVVSILADRVDWHILSFDFKYVILTVGTGLGLSICKRNVILLGGNIGVISAKDEGKKELSDYV